MSRAGAAGEVRCITLTPVRSFVAALARIYGPAPADISGAEASYRTFPWIVLLWIAVVVALLLPNSLAGGLLIALVVVLVGLGWWTRVGCHWHPIHRIRHSRT
jgi:hypothetical protein